MFEPVHPWKVRQRTTLKFRTPVRMLHARLKKSGARPFVGSPPSQWQVVPVAPGFDQVLTKF